jgi:glycosyltransferase involved in cell wall biosynthesis
MSDRHSPAAVGQGELRVALVTDGVAPAVSELRQRGIAGHEIDVIGTEPSVDRRLPAVTVAEALTERDYDLVHVCGPGPAGLAAVLIARMMHKPVVGSYTSEPADSGQARTFYDACRVVLSPSRAADESLRRIGIPAQRVERWEPGVDLELFNPSCYSPQALPSDCFNVVYSGRLCREQGLELLSEAFLIARDRDYRLHLVLIGEGPAELALRRRLGSAATFLGTPDAPAMAAVYASAELFVCPSPDDSLGPAILEAQASGLPVLAVEGSGAAELIESGRSGCLVPADPAMLGSAIRGLARRGAVRERLATGGLHAARERSWDRSLAQVAGGWSRALGRSAGSDQVAHAA